MYSSLNKPTLNVLSGKNAQNVPLRINAPKCVFIKMPGFPLFEIFKISFKKVSLDNFWRSYPSPSPCSKQGELELDQLTESLV